MDLRRNNRDRYFGLKVEIYSRMLEKDVKIQDKTELAELKELSVMNEMKTVEWVKSNERMTDILNTEGVKESGIKYA